ncbi:MAG: ferric reductase-like transmembrane domain-containing protein [Acidimicrobiales bacterium]|nr:ferric reductase-like transmembrane domain-containing protein [Acidimicrobiales bacterium]
MEQLWWYTARAGGIVSWALLSASVLWGLALSTKVFGKRPRPNWLLDMHQWLGALTMIFLGVHVVALMFDSYVDFGLTDVLVPFASDWDPSAVAWGIVAFYLLLAVELTALGRRWMPKKVWRSVHYLSFPVFVLATVHGVAAGTDATTTMAIALVVVVVALVSLLSFVRLDQAARQAKLNAEAGPSVRPAPRSPRPAAPVSAAPEAAPVAAPATAPVAPPAYRPPAGAAAPRPAAPASPPPPARRPAAPAPVPASPPVTAPAPVTAGRTVY